MKRIRKGLLAGLGAIVLVAIAYVLGGQAAGLYKDWDLSRKRDKYRARAAAQTESILRQMGTIKVGDTLPNYSFEDIDGTVFLLSQLVTDRTVITYIKPDCEACLIEMEHLQKAARDSSDFARVLLISSANPMHLKQLKADYGLGCRAFYDNERFFASALKISSFPFNVIVNRDRVITEINASSMMEDDYKKLFGDN